MVFKLSRCAHSAHRYRSIIITQASRCYSTEASPLQELQASLHAELTSRPAVQTLDNLNPFQSHLLNITLADFLPSDCQPAHFSSKPPSRLRAPPTNKPNALPQGHHLVYFAPRILEKDLLPDGTDTEHSPGAPFVRRLWAGGSLVFHPQTDYILRLSKHNTSSSAVCVEDITDVKVTGSEGKEKVFVEIRRRVRGIHARFDGRIKGDTRPIEECWDTLDPSKGPDGGIGMFALVEKRTLVFMRGKSEEEVKEDVEKQLRIVKPFHTPEYSVSIKPSRNLIFRWSALSFNAHRIHLDPQYCREVEGYRDLLVHGPLTLVLMLSVLRSRLPRNQRIMRFDYRNLAPLYVDEEMKICLRKNAKHNVEKEDKYDVWIEGKDGGYAVKGTAICGYLIPSAHTKTSPVENENGEEEKLGSHIRYVFPESST